MKVTEPTLEQEVASYLAVELGAQIITQASTRRKQPDIILILNGCRFVLELKIGGERELIQAVSQAYEYMLLVDADGLIGLVYPGNTRKTVENQEDVQDIVLNTPISALVLSPTHARNYSSLTLGEFTEKSRAFLFERMPSIDIGLVTKVMREAVETLSLRIRRHHKVYKPVLDTVINKFELFQALSSPERAQSAEIERDLDATACDLAAYILVNQMLLYHLLHKSLNLPPLPTELRRISKLDDYFDSITEIDYKAVYSVDIVQSLPETAKADVVKISLALRAIKPENLPRDLLGRFFHEFLPFETRKTLATFYTKPVAAELLATLSVKTGKEVVIDPACGSGTLLVSAYHRERNITGDRHSRVLKRILGIDVMPFASHLSALNLTLQDLEKVTDEVKIGVGNALDFEPGTGVPSQLSLLPIQRAQASAEVMTEGFELPESLDLVIMNPPFTDRKRLKKGMLGGRATVFNKPQNYWAYFLHLADGMLCDRGRIGAVLPRLFVAGSFSAEVRKWLFSTGRYSLRYIVKTCKEIAFSEAAKFRDYLVVLDKAVELQRCGVVYIKRSIDTMTVEEARNIASRILKVKVGRSHTEEDFALTWVRHSQIKTGWENLSFLVAFEDPENASILQSFTDKCLELSEKHLARLDEIPHVGEKRGFEPKPTGLYDAIFVVRELCPKRVERSLIVLSEEKNERVDAILGSMPRVIKIPKECLTPALKTASYVTKWNVNDITDWVITKRFKGYREQVENIAGIRVDFNYVNTSIKKRRSHLLVVKRIDLSAPGTSAIAFYSDKQMVSTNVFYSVTTSKDYSIALCLWLNSTFGISQVLRKRMETRGSYCDLLLETLRGLPVPTREFVEQHLPTFRKLMKRFGTRELPSLLKQFSNPPDLRIELDTAILKILGYSLRRLMKFSPLSILRWPRNFTF